MAAKHWTRLSDFHPHHSSTCASDHCNRRAVWHFEVGGIGSQYCDGCKVAIEIIDDFGKRWSDGKIYITETPRE